MSELLPDNALQTDVSRNITLLAFAKGRAAFATPLSASVRPPPRAASGDRVYVERVTPETRSAILLLADRAARTGRHSVNALRQRHEQWRAAVNARDIEAYAELVAEDVVWIPPAGDAIVGRQAFREWLEPFFEAYDYEYSESNTSFLTAGDWIAERSDFESRMTPVVGGVTMSHAGVYVVIWRRDSDAIWRIDRYVDQGPLGES